MKASKIALLWVVVFNLWWMHDEGWRGAALFPVATLAFYPMAFGAVMVFAVLSGRLDEWTDERKKS